MCWCGCGCVWVCTVRYMIKWTIHLSMLPSLRFEVKTFSVEHKTDIFLDTKVWYYIVIEGPTEFSFYLKTYTNHERLMWTYIKSLDI